MAHRFTLARYDVEAVAPKGSTVWKYMRSVPEDPDDQYAWYGGMIGLCWPADPEGWEPFDLDGGNAETWLAWGLDITDHLNGRGATLEEIGRAALVAQNVGIERLNGPTLEGVKEKEDFSEAPADPSSSPTT